MKYWLAKSEPGNYAWNDLKKDKKTVWDGVRNYQARNFMKEMKKGDQVFFYHSVKERNVIGIMEVIGEAAQDPTTSDDRWIAVKVKVGETLANPVNLTEIKANPKLSEIRLVTNSRLSVMPLKAGEFKEILKMSNSKS